MAYNLISEKEAKKKWCPMVRLFVDKNDTTEDNRQFNGIVPECIASQCMMWRVLTVSNKPDTLGYCGLAGIPQA